MHRKLVGGLLTAVLAALAVGPAAAQETGTPIFKEPYRSFQDYELGGSASFFPGATALEGFYTYGHGPYDVGLRGGFLTGGGTRVLAGASFRARVVQATESFPLDGALTLGVGAQIGDGPDVLFVPVGISVGRRFLVENSRLTFTPYAQPILVPIIQSGNDQVHFALGLGVDVAITRAFSARLSVGIGDDPYDHLGLGVAFAH